MKPLVWERSLVSVLFFSAVLLRAQPPAPGPVQVPVTPANSAVAVGATKQFGATEVFIGAKNRSGASRNVGACFKWRSSNPSVATINLNSGLALAAAAGQTVISANCGPFRGSTSLTVQAAVCGDAIRQAGEQCDDGNTANLDACNSVCDFEQDQRMNSITMQFSTDTICTKNALGVAIGASIAQSSLQNAITADVNNGSISFLFAMLGVTDLSGTNEPSFKMGVLNGAPVLGTGYNGASDLDWWYTPDPIAIDGNRVPLDQLGASITSGALTAGPGSLPFPPLFGSSGNLQLSSAVLKATIGAASTPTSSAGATPGHLAAENLDPNLKSYGSMSGGSVCGGVGAASLAATPVPTALQQGGGASACTEGYTTTNSLLDVFVGGCTVVFITAISKTQPDSSDPSAPAAGAGAPYKLTTNASHQVNACTDKNGTSVSLSACLAAAAYSSYFKFTTDRVIIK